MAKVVFPVSLLLFTAPLPPAAVNAVETFFQHTSAEVAAVFFKMSGTPFLRDNLAFSLPGITIEVAPECSGIHSSLVLFIVSLLSGYLVLHSPGRRIIFALAVVPLGILRNGFRIFTIGMLCVHVGPEMINSPIHHRGGPLFFVLSLVPFFLLLIFLRNSEREKTGSGSTRGAPPMPELAIASRKLT